MSSIENPKSNVSTPEKSGPKAYATNFEQCFKKEEEFKELLDNLDIENIEIVLSARPKNKPEEEEINLDIEKLLSEADEEEYEGEDIAQHLQIKGKKQSRSDDENSKDGEDLKLGNKFSSRARRLQIFEKITIEDK